MTVFISGETSDKDIKALRLRQIKNFHVALMVSQVTFLKMNQAIEIGSTLYFL